MSPVQTERAGATRRRILQSAEHLFVERGIAATSMNEIIAASGVTKGGFYFHFTSKAELAAAVVEMIAAEQRAEVMAALGAHERAVDQLAELVRLAAISHETPSAAAMCRLGFELSGTSGAPPMDAFGEWFDLTAALFRRAQAEGDMDPDVDPDAAARFAVTSFIGHEHVAELRREPQALTEHIEAYLAFTFRAVSMRVPVPAPLPPGPPPSPHRSPSQ